MISRAQCTYTWKATPVVQLVPLWSARCALWYFFAKLAQLSPLGGSRYICCAVPYTKGRLALLSPFWCALQAKAAGKRGCAACIWFSHSQRDRCIGQYIIRTGPLWENVLARYQGLKIPHMQKLARVVSEFCSRQTQLLNTFSKILRAQIIIKLI